MLGREDRERPRVGQVGRRAVTGGRGVGRVLGRLARARVRLGDRSFRESGLGAGGVDHGVTSCRAGRDTPALER